MARRNSVLGFALRAIVIYGFLVAPWPGLRESYARGFRWTARVVYGHFGGDGIVTFHPLEDGNSRMDTQIRLGKRGVPYAGPTEYNTRIGGYLPTAAVIALILATPIPWSRRWLALVWGLVGVHAFLALRMALNLFRWYCEDRTWALYDPGPTAHKLVICTWEVILGTPTSIFLAPFFIWIIVTFRRSDWEIFFKAATNGADRKARR